MLCAMILEDTPLATDELASPAADDAVETAAVTVDEPGTAVSWHLSPGYSTHLHAYELAMLPGDPRRSDS